MKKKVYEKQLSQLRSEMTSNKRETKAKTKSKKSRSSRQENQTARPKASTSGKTTTLNDHVGTKSQTNQQPKVGTLPKVDVLIKRRFVESEPNVAKPSSVTLSAAVKEPTFPSPHVREVSGSTELTNMEEGSTPSSVHENVALSGNSAASSDIVTASDVGSGQESAKGNQSRPESIGFPPASSSYRIDLNKSVDGVDCTAVGEQIQESDVSCSLPENISVFVTTTKSGDLAPSARDDFHIYAPVLTGSTPPVTDVNVPLSQTYVMPDTTQAASVVGLTSAGAISSQPVALVSSPQMDISGQYTHENRAHFSTHLGDYGLPQYQTMANTMSNELHTLTPMILPDTRRFDDTTTASKLVNYGDLHPVSSGPSWEQENNRYTEYPTTWRNHSNEGVYHNNGIPHALKMPFVNGNSTNLSSIEMDNSNDDTGLPHHNTRSKFYPHVHQHHEISEDDKKESDSYGYTSDDSSSAKISVGGSNRRRRKRVQTPVQRSAANMRERRRMCHLNDAFNYLKEHLPNVKDKKKLSRIQTLKAAIYYIHLLRDSLELQ